MRMRLPYSALWIIPTAVLFQELVQFCVAFGVVYVIFVATLRHRLAYQDALLLFQEQLRMENRPPCVLWVCDELLRRKCEYALWMNGGDVDPDDIFCKMNPEVLRDAKMKIGIYEQSLDKTALVCRCEVVLQAMGCVKDMGATFAVAIAEKRGCGCPSLWA